MKVRRTVFNASIFSAIVILQMLLCLATTYKEYVEKQKLNLYGTMAVSSPQLELWAAYIGDRKDVLEAMQLSDLHGGAGDAEVRVEVLRGTESRDIAKQYNSISYMALVKFGAI